MFRTEREATYYRCARNHTTFGDERCRDSPRDIRTKDLDDAVLAAVREALADESTLRQLAAVVHPADVRARDTEASQLRKGLAAVKRRKTNIVFRLADEGNLHTDVLGEALAVLDDEEAGLHVALDRVEAATRTPSVNDLLDRMDPTEVLDCALRDLGPEGLAELFDILEIDLVARVEGRNFAGTASIPLPDPRDLDSDGRPGEVCEGAPRRQYLDVPALRLVIPTSRPAL